MYRKIIHDEDRLKEFVDTVLDPNEYYILRYMSRKKWYRAKEQRESVVVKGNSADVLLATRKFERPESTYLYPPEAYAVYIQFNPRDVNTAGKKMAHKMIDYISDQKSVQEQDYERLWVKCLSPERLRQDYWLLDIDRPDDPVKDFDLEFPWTTKSRQGWHKLVKISKGIRQTKSHLFQEINKLDEVSIHKDDFTVLPGTMQSDHKAE